MVVLPSRSPFGESKAVVRYTPYGEARDFIQNKEKEILYEGPAGTGKSYACLFKVHFAMLKYPGARALIVRKTLVSLTASALVTFINRILPTGNYGVTFFGGSSAEPAQFRYPNGSAVVVGGMDKSEKVMSAEYDLAYVNEATELTEDNWEAITSRLRYGVMPYQQLLADCNPQAPQHWLHQRTLSGLTTNFGSKHEDNPILFDHEAGDWTERGREYMATLDRLTGVRYKRLRLGLWVAAEGQVYENWDPALHVISRRDAEDRLAGAWFFGAADWGWTNPGVLQVWGVDRDGRLLLVAEHYQTGKPVESWWVDRAEELTRFYGIREWVCDPSEPQYIALFNARGLNASKATNDIMPGIVAVQERLQVQPDGLPRLQILEDALQSRDPHLIENKLPFSTEQEVPEYVWSTAPGGEQLRDKPVDMNNHGLDTMRYAVARQDLRGKVGVLRPVDAVTQQRYFRGLPR